MYRSYSRPRLGTVNRSELSVAWDRLLFNLVFIPFLFLLMALMVNQIISVRNYAAGAETQEAQPDAFIHETFN